MECVSSRPKVTPTPKLPDRAALHRSGFFSSGLAVCLRKADLQNFKDLSIKAAKHRRTPRRKRAMSSRGDGHVLECGDHSPLWIYTTVARKSRSNRCMTDAKQIQKAGFRS